MALIGEKILNGETHAELGLMLLQIGMRAVDAYIDQNNDDLIVDFDRASDIIANTNSFLLTYSRLN